MFLDFFGALASLLSTYYFIRLHQKAWLISLIATSLNTLLYWQKGIYADMVLELFYFLSACYGWYLWQKPTKQLDPVRTLSKNQWCLLLSAFIICYLLLSSMLATYTSSTVVKLDALTTSLSLVAQWLMCFRAVATWFFWLLTDAIYAYLYLSKQLTFHCLLMIIYLIMAVMGYLTWTKLSVKIYN